MKMLGRQSDSSSAQQIEGIAPIVTKPRRGLSGIAITIIAAIMAVMLFSVLEAKRQSAQSPAVVASNSPATQTINAPPPLEIPAPPASLTSVYPQVVQPAPQPQEYIPQRQYPRAAADPIIIQRSPPPYAALPNPIEPPASPKRTSSGSALILDNGIAAAGGQEAAGDRNKGTLSPGTNDRAKASILANRSTTVAQGTLIRAVLETALDSTNPGFARALVSRDIYSFDGTRVVIARGSRLIGEYGTDSKSGQNRALVNWTRLIRPDGATINIGSPSADTLGRGGIKADVNTHFLERFGSALLQSVLNIGANAAARNSSGTVIYSLPGSQVSAVGGALEPRQTVPTLRVKAGTSVSVFVARDLDFSDVEIR